VVLFNKLEVWVDDKGGGGGRGGERGGKGGRGGKDDLWRQGDFDE
jgi:hypothetical protein